MQIWYENIPGYLYLEVLDGDGKPAAGLSIDYSIRNSATDVEVFSGVLIEANSVYSKSITITTKGEYKATYTTPSGYEDCMEIISVKDYDDYKADVSDLALEASVQDVITDTGLIKIETDKIPSLVLDSAKIETILQMETGKWKIINNQMVFYAQNNSTEVCRFNLFDADGNPTSTAATERRRV